MASEQYEIAEPIAKGTFASAKQSFGDLFKWKQRVEITNEYGETLTVWQKPAPLKNPISLLAMLSAKQWLFFLVGLAAWTADAFDFHALSIQTTKLAKYYDRSKTDITTAITLTLLLRSVGAAFFGLLADRFGRKWPMVANMVSRRPGVAEILLMTDRLSLVFCKSQQSTQRLSEPSLL